MCVCEYGGVIHAGGLIFGWAYIWNGLSALENMVGLHLGAYNIFEKKYHILSI